MKLILITGFFFIFGNLSAQELVTDRPDFTESPLVVPAGMIQIESGLEWEETNSVNNFSYPTVLARIGLGHCFEFRAGFGGWTKIKINDQSKTCLNDMLLEAKYQISQNPERPLAILLVATLPTGDATVSTESPEIGLKLAWSIDFTDRLGLGVNLGAISVDTGNRREIQSLGSVALGIGLTQKMGSFIEILAEIPASETWQPVLDGGFTYLMTPAAQGDLYLGKGLNTNTADFIVGAGFSFRFSY